MCKWKYLAVTISALGLGACATIPKPLAGAYSDVTPASAVRAGTQQVRWGGQIIATEPQAARTCFFMLWQPLDGSARPRQENNKVSDRFVACKSGFYDPEVFSKGRQLTFIGRLDGSMTRKVGKYDYTYPLLRAKVIYLWKPRPTVMYYRGPFYGPWWGPWGSHWSGFYDPFYYPPPVIYRQ